MRRTWRWALAMFLAAVTLAGAEVQPNSLFSDNAVLQRGKPLPVWGTAEAGETVTVSLQGCEAKTVADAAGKWLVKLPAMKAGGPYELTIAGPANTVKLSNVLLGEVWVCSGQSNMQFNLARAIDAEKYIPESADPGLRLFSVPLRHSDLPLDDCHSKWVVAAPETVPGFSAVGYFFGQQLRQDLGVPVGLIHSSWGGTPAQAWTRWNTLNKIPELQHYYWDYVNACKAWPDNLEKWQEAVADWKVKAAEAKAAGKPAPRQPGVPYGPKHQSRPGALYRAMIYPLQPYAIQGAIWYQGESNAGRAYEYRTLMPAMIQDWRDSWGQGDFPFLMVQLAPFMKISEQPTESAWAELREAQLLSTKALPNVGMAVITDVGEENDIHPRQKQPVGARLAYAAEHIAYGKKLTWSGPEYSHLRVDGSQARVFFDHTDGGLVAKDGPLTGFTICGPDHQFYNATARISGRTVVVCAPEVSEPVAVRFGWANFPVVNLWNQGGLPATPFRTDNFKAITDK